LSKEKKDNVVEEIKEVQEVDTKKKAPKKVKAS
jgi:hypothetical protein